jgi:TonB-dependent Receptor Plug Domain
MAQVNTGELRLKVIDSTEIGIKATVALSSEANQYFSEFTTDADGTAEIKTLSYGVYRLKIEKQGFSSISKTLEIRSAIPVKRTLQLAIAPINTVVQVTDAGTLLDPNRPSSIMQIGSAQIEDRVASFPRRSLQDLVNSQPGWLYEGNAVLHPRGSEYQTQLVVDGIPLTDNRSPGFGPEIEADDLDSISIYTAGIPAEYGRKLGGLSNSTPAVKLRPVCTANWSWVVVVMTRSSPSDNCRTLGARTRYRQAPPAAVPVITSTQSCRRTSPTTALRQTSPLCTSGTSLLAIASL